MKKLNNKGFLMVEVIVVTTLITLFSITLYSFTNTTIQKFEVRDTYNTPESLYKAANLKSYYYTNEYVAALSTATIVPVDNVLYDITGNYSDAYYINLKQQLGVKNIYITKYGLTGTSNYKIDDALYDPNLGEALKYFVNWIPNNTTLPTDPVYRLIVAFNDKTYATIKL